MTTKAVFLDTEQAQAIEYASRYLATLARAERAYMLEDEADLGAVFGGIDPSELPYVENVLRNIFMAWQVLPAAPVGSEPQASAQPSPSLRDVSAESADGASEDQPSEPTYSVRVP